MIDRALGPDGEPIEGGESIELSELEFSMYLLNHEPLSMQPSEVRQLPVRVRQAFVALVAREIRARLNRGNRA